MVVEPFKAARRASEKSVAAQWLDFLRRDLGALVRSGNSFIHKTISPGCYRDGAKMRQDDAKMRHHPSFMRHVAYRPGRPGAQRRAYDVAAAADGTAPG